MKIEGIDIMIDGNSINPALHINTKISYYQGIEIPVSIAGMLKTSDEKVVAYLQQQEISPYATDHSFHLKALSQDAKDEIRRSEPYSYLVSLTALLSPKAIKHITTIREKKINTIC